MFRYIAVILEKHDTAEQMTFHIKITAKLGKYQTSFKSLLSLIILYTIHHVMFVHVWAIWKLNVKWSFGMGINIEW